MITFAKFQQELFLMKIRNSINGNAFDRGSYHALLDDNKMITK
jgi:hypothetical protein